MSRASLSPAHKRMLFEESHLDARVAVKRGYRTVASKAALERLGFGRSQRNIPALLIPIYGSTGEVVLYQSRPDHPRIGRRGKPVKYETPAGASMALDVHPFCRKSLADPEVPLFVTEGIKKGDSLVSQSLCAVALIGVWNWRGANEHGGKTALAEWEYVALNGRKVYVVFDSDVMEKREVHAALARLKAFLEHRGARVRLIYLPPGEGGAKQGVDDYLASGYTVDELLEHATPELKQPPNKEGGTLPYRATSTGLVWAKPTQSGTVPTPLTNFTASITADVAEDDGAELKRYFEIEANLNDRRALFSVPSSQFAGMSWATEHLGAGAIIYPGFGIKDHARAAVQLLSGDVQSRHVYSHTGWRKIGSEWAYLHAGGAIGQVGQVGDVYVELTGSLEGRTLPEPPEGEELMEAVRATLGFWRLAPEVVTVPLLAGIYRAALGETDFSLHLSGPTGEGKSELAALCQQHYGVGLDARRLTSWESTENAVEGQAFQAKDQLMVLDDFAPTGSSYDVQRWHKKADRVLRAKGNASGRQRMRPDTTLRPEKPPRALILSTGEDVPRGQSLRARMLLLELSPGDLDWRKLTVCQRDATGGLYAQAMAGFVRWVVPRYGEIRASLREERAALREWAARSAQHKRTPGIVADLALGLRYFLLFAHDAGALTAEEAEGLWLKGWRALGKAAAAQHQHQAAGEPTRRLSELLSAAIASGRAHVADPEGDQPEEPAGWGWRRTTVGTGGYEREEWRPLGERIGWAEGEDLYLLPEAAYATAQKQGRDSGEPLAVTERTLRKRLHEQSLLLSVEESRPTLAVRRTLGGQRRGVLHLSTDFLSLHADQPDQPDHGEGKWPEHADLGPPLWSGANQQPDRETDQELLLNAGGQVTGQTHREPDRSSDRREARRQARNSGAGQVGQISDNDRKQKVGAGARGLTRERFTI